MVERPLEIAEGQRQPEKSDRAVGSRIAQARGGLGEPCVEACGKLGLRRVVVRAQFQREGLCRVGGKRECELRSRACGALARCGRDDLEPRGLCRLLNLACQNFSAHARIFLNFLKFHEIGAKSILRLWAFHSPFWPRWTSSPKFRGLSIMKKAHLTLRGRDSLHVGARRLYGPIPTSL